MKNKELIKLLQQYPADIDIRLLPTSDIPIRGYKDAKIIPFTEENILYTSEGAWVDDEAPADEWDCEDGKIRHEGKWYLLLNPIIT